MFVRLHGAPTHTALVSFQLAGGLLDCENMNILNGYSITSIVS